MVHIKKKNLEKETKKQNSYLIDIVKHYDDNHYKSLSLN